MPKIASYATVSPSITDKLLGSQDNTAETTNNFEIGDVLQLGDQYFAPNDYGYFYDTTTQTVSVNNVNALKYGQTVYSNNVSIQSDGSEYTEITMVNAGTYNFQFSAQLERLSGGGDVDIVIWLRHNGTDVAASSTKITMRSGAKYGVAAWNFFHQVAAGDNIQIMWTQSGNIVIPHFAANTTIPYPEVPSVILSVNRIA